MDNAIRIIQEALTRLWHSVRGWVREPFRNAYRWGMLAALYAGLCLVLPAGVGLALFAPVACTLVAKAAFAMRGVRALEFVSVARDAKHRRVLVTRGDRLQRAWSLASLVLVIVAVVALTVRWGVSLFGLPHLSDTLIVYGGFMGVLLVGFLLCYYLALRSDNTLLRGLTSLVVTLPVFFVLVVVASVALSWVTNTLVDIGVTPAIMLELGRDGLYRVQRVLGAATSYFLEQDTTIILVSIVFAVFLLVVYTLTIPQYWRVSVAKWLRGISFVAAAFGAAVIVFAGVWLADLQEFVVESVSGQLTDAVDSSVIDSQATSLSQYENSDFIALIRAFVLPYIVGVFMANVVLTWRRNRAKAIAYGIIDDIAARGEVDDDELSHLEKRYAYHGGGQTLWDIALRSVGQGVELPQPIMPRPLTLRERVTGQLEAPVAVEAKSAKPGKPSRRARKAVGALQGKPQQDGLRQDEPKQGALRQGKPQHEEEGES